MTRVFCRRDSSFEFRHSFVIRHWSFVIMSDVQIHPTAIIDPGAEIGSGTIVGPYCVIGPDVVLGPNCWLQHHVIFSNNGTLAGHVQVGNHAMMGGLTAVHQFCRIGRFAITGGCSKIVQDVPPFMIADGNPAEIRGINLIGLERKNFPPESVKLIKEAFRLIYRSKYNTHQALESMREELPQTEEITEIVEFIEQSERGIIRRDFNRGLRE